MHPKRIQLRITHQYTGRKRPSLVQVTAKRTNPKHASMPEESPNDHPQPRATPLLNRALSEMIINHELFNCNIINIRYRSWNYRGCWHQTCPPVGYREVLLNFTHCDIAIHEGSYSLFHVTTSPCKEWVSYAPAAVLGCGSHFSGSLSGTER